MSKSDPDYWYNDVDVNKMLRRISNGAYSITDAATKDDEQLTQRINESFDTLENSDAAVAVIPINLGASAKGVYQGSHWTGLMIRKIQGKITDDGAAAAALNPKCMFEAFYMDSMMSA